MQMATWTAAMPRRAAHARGVETFHRGGQCGEEGETNERVAVVVFFTGPASDSAMGSWERDPVVRGPSRVAVLRLAVNVGPGTTHRPL